MNTETTALERINLLKDLVSISVSSAHGIHQFSEQQLGQTIAGLVRNKLLSAEDSYKLQDSLKDTKAFDRMVQSRIDRALEKKGMISQSRINELDSRLSRIEAKRSA